MIRSMNVIIMYIYNFIEIFPNWIGFRFDDPVMMTIDNASLITQHAQIQHKKFDSNLRSF